MTAGYEGRIANLEKIQLKILDSSDPGGTAEGSQQQSRSSPIDILLTAAQDFNAQRELSYN